MPKNVRQPRTMYLVWRASEAISNLADRQRGMGGLALSKYVVLSFVRDRGNLTSADIARRLGHTPQSTNETISSLEQAGLLKKQTSPLNRKSKFLSITNLGLEALEETETQMDQIERQAFIGLGESGLVSLREALQKVIDASKQAITGLPE
jgi:DNA-binding MarR family transcriptional regulator